MAPIGDGFSIKRTATPAPLTLSLSGLIWKDSLTNPMNMGLYYNTRDFSINWVSDNIIIIS